MEVNIHQWGVAKQERACSKEYIYRKGNITEVIYEANLKEAVCACVSVQYNEVKDNSHSNIDDLAF